MEKAKNKSTRFQLKLRKDTKRVSSIKENTSLWIMASPTIALLLLFCYFPMFGLVLAFKNYNVSKGIFLSDWSGFKNFQFLFATSDAFVITRNTVLYNLAFIIVNMLLAVTFALMLNELRSKRTANALQTIYMMPYFLSWAVVAILLTAFLDRENGLVNQILIDMGAEKLVDWYQRKEIWPWLLIFVNAWKNAGYQTVLYLAVISGINQTYYEAAVLDGASKWQQARYITIPHLRFVMSISLITSMGSIFRGDFGLFYTVTKDSGPLYPVTDVIDTYIYRALTAMNNTGMSTAAGFYQSVVGLIMVIIVNKIVNKIDPESGMF